MSYLGRAERSQVFRVSDQVRLKPACLATQRLARIRTLVKSALPKFNFLISQPKHMLWVLKRTVLMKQNFSE